MPRRLPPTFGSLHNRNFRVYIAARLAATVGAWIQITAENWLVLQLTDSGLALGITNALQFGPLLLFGLYGGVLADRLDRRRLLVVTQSAQAALAAAVGLLVATGAIELWMIWLAALLAGLVMAVDHPALHGFVKDLAGEADLPNAVALNNAVTSAGRMAGPAVSGLSIVAFGLAPSFFVNAAAFALVVLVLTRLGTARLYPSARAAPEPGQVRAGLAYVRQDRVLRLTVTAMSAVFLTAYNFQVLVPLLTARLLGGSSALYGLVMSSLGFGAVTGSLLIASRVAPGVMRIALCCGLISLAHAGLALPLGSYAAVAGVYLLGVVCGVFNVTVAGTLQMRARDDMRGRVMALYSIGILGSGLVGAPLVGAVADKAGVPATYAMIAAVCAGTAAATAWAWLRRRDAAG